jgi:hypothetical protein
MHINLLALLYFLLSFRFASSKVGELAPLSLGKSPPPQLGVILFDAVSAGFSPNSLQTLSTLSRVATDACSIGLATVRFSVSPIYPDEFSLWRTNSSLFWINVNSAIKQMTSGGCKLVPVLFWNPFLVPDTYGFQGLRSLVVGAANITNNTAWDASLRFIADATRRLSIMSNVIAWELVNEANLLFDVDNSVDRGGHFIDKIRLTASERTTAADNITTDEWRLVQLQWAAVIRANDPIGRPIGSGHSLARREAEALRANYATGKNSFGLFDTFDQFVRNLNDTHQGLDWASIHLTPGDTLVRWNLTNVTAYATNLLLYVTAAASNISIGRSRGPLSVYIGAFEQAASEDLIIIQQKNTAAAAARRAGGGGGIDNSKKNAVSKQSSTPNSGAMAAITDPTPTLDGRRRLQRPIYTPASFRAQQAPRPFIDSVLNTMRITAPSVPAGSVPFPGVKGIITYAFVTGWEDALVNGTTAIWPGDKSVSTTGVLESLVQYASVASAALAASTQTCDGATFLSSFNYRILDTDTSRQRCQERINALVQQKFSPPSPFEAFRILCKGVCRKYTAHWFRLLEAAKGTGCDCVKDINKGSFFCPTSAPEMLCRTTGLCVNETYYEKSTCAAEACGRFTTNEKDWRAARRSCAK